MIDTLTTRADVGIVGPLLLKADGQTVEEFGGVIDYKSLEITKLYRNYLLDHSIPDEQYVGFISGGINLTRREVFEGIGLQDERLFMYGDETDFNMRAKKAGWKLLVKSSIVAIHEHQGKASSFKPMCEYLLARNELWLARKHLDKKTYIFLAIQKLIDFPRHLGAHLKRRQFGLAIAYTKGVFHGLIRNRNEQVY
jgi:GT2 family glycosyltransferase